MDTPSFSDTDDTSVGNFKSSIWRYGNIEFHFNEEDQLIMIFSDYIDTLDGGPDLRLHKWIFEKPKELSLENVVRHLVAEQISYALAFRELSKDYTFVEITIPGSGVKLSFIPDESEGADSYPEHLKKPDSNLFQLSSFNLMTK